MHREDHYDFYYDDYESLGSPIGIRINHKQINYGDYYDIYGMDSTIKILAQTQFVISLEVYNIVSPRFGFVQKAGHTQDTNASDTLAIELLNTST